MLEQHVKLDHMKDVLPQNPAKVCFQIPDIYRPGKGADLQSGMRWRDRGLQNTIRLRISDLAVETQQATGSDHFEICRT